MEKVTVIEADRLSNGWIDPKYVPEGGNKYDIRNLQAKEPAGGWRHLRADEIETLVNNRNTAHDWNNIYVSDVFNPSAIKNNKFYGMVRIGRVSGNGLQYHDLQLPVGITNSSIHSCDIGDDCAVHDVHYLSHYIIGSRCILFNLQEMSTTDHSKFGNGILKDGEDPSVRVSLNVMNENGRRKVWPFDGMNTADAYLQAKYVEDEELCRRFAQMTQDRCDNRRGYYGQVGNGCVIKNSSIIKDVKIGESCYIKGASKLKNITINSSESEQSQIGENVILVNGIVGYGCKLFYGCIGAKFVMGSNCSLKYGARLIDSILGDNSTISCCEVLNNLVFPCHEQHHNNSFLIASLVMGQSNMAAGATIGSNHNSRSNDGEVVAGRGFWPGLCSSIKHSSRFASCTLLAKGDYSYELNVPLPFSLVSNNAADNCLEIMPAYWWMYNMYALARNTGKYFKRDRRKTKNQNIEFDIFAPDTMDEVLGAIKLLEGWAASASPDGTVELADSGIENSRRSVRILKVPQALEAYRSMLLHYSVLTVAGYLHSNPGMSVDDICRSESSEGWTNLGGQIVRTEDVERMIGEIRNGTLSTWDMVHARYESLWAAYPAEKARHAYGVLCSLYGVKTIGKDVWNNAVKEAISLSDRITEAVRTSRVKDFDNRFRRATFRNDAEMEAVTGKPEDDEFIIETVSLARARRQLLESSLL